MSKDRGSWVNCFYKKKKKKKKKEDEEEEEEEEDDDDDDDDNEEEEKKSITLSQEMIPVPIHHVPAAPNTALSCIHVSLCICSRCRCISISQTYS